MSRYSHSDAKPAMEPVDKFIFYAQLSTLGLGSIWMYILYADVSVTDIYDRHFGPPSVKERLYKQRETNKRIDKVIKTFKTDLMQQCKKEIEPPSILKFLEKYNGYVYALTFENWKQMRESESPKSDTAASVTETVTEPVTEPVTEDGKKWIEISTPTGVSSIKVSPKHEEWLLFHGKGLTEEQVARAERDKEYRRGIEDEERNARHAASLEWLRGQREHEMRQLKAKAKDCNGTKASESG